MAHGVIPPFCGMLVSEALVEQLCSFDVPKSDLALLGNAANEVIVPLEAAEAYSSILRLAYQRYLASGAVDLRDADGAFDRDSQLVLALLMGAVLDVDRAAECLNSLMPHLVDEQSTSWRALVNGPLRSTIQSVEEQVGTLIKECAKDVYTHAPEDTGFERLDWALAV